MESDTISKNGASSKSRMSRINLLRRPLLFGLLCLFGTMTLFAAKRVPLVTVASGDASVLKKPSTAILEIDFSDTKIGEETMEEYQQRRGEDFIRDWQEAMASTYITFIKFFNKKLKKGIQLTAEETKVAYKMIIHVNYLNMGDSFSLWIPYSSTKAGGLLMKGTIDIIDMETNNVVCILNVDGVKGVGVPRVKDRLQSMFNYLADNIYIVK